MADALIDSQPFIRKATNKTVSFADLVELDEDLTAEQVIQAEDGCEMDVSDD